jgi:hypothetical protein
MQPAVGQGLLDDAIAAHPPVPFPATRRQLDLVRRCAQGGQMTTARPGPLPLFPVVAAGQSSNLTLSC